MEPSTRDPEVEGFLALLATRRAPKTVDAYRRDLVALGAWLDRPVGRITTEQLEQYLAELRAAGLSPSTISRRVAAIRSFFRHQVLLGARTDNPAAELDLPRRRRTLPRTLSPAEAERLVANHKIGPIYTPAVPFNPNGPVSTLMVMGGSNWPGNSYDPDNKIVFVTSTVAVNSMTICRYAEGSVMPHGVCTGPDAGSFGGLRNLSVQGLPLLKPPYGTIAAFDLTKGEKLWEVPNGDTPDNVRNHPLLKGLTIPKTGQAGTSGIGLMATKTLVVMGDPQLTTTPEHPRGAMLRAYDKTNGSQVGMVHMPAPQSGSPMTYLAGGRQYIVVAISGGNYSGEYLAFALPR